MYQSLLITLADKYTKGKIDLNDALESFENALSRQVHGLKELNDKYIS